MTVTGSMTPDEALERLRSFCLLLPETAEIEVFDNPTFRVATNTFATFDRAGDSPVISFKASLDEQAAIVDGERFTVAPEIGDHGWTNARIDRPLDWSHLDELLVASYRLVAPDWCVLELDALLADPD
jgi:predicted DNA-binding protein (MmcQ/YjbR family)